LSYLDARGEVRSVSTSPLPLSIRALVEETAAAPEPQPARGPRVGMIEDRRVVLAVSIAVVAVGLILLALLVRRLWRARKRRAAAPARSVRRRPRRRRRCRRPPARLARRRKGRQRAMKQRLRRLVPVAWPYALLCAIAAPFAVLAWRLLREPDVHLKDRAAL